MAIRSGLAHQLGVAAETTYGTYVAPSRWYEDVSCEFDLVQEEIESESLRAGNMVLRSDRRVNDRQGVEGSIELEVQTKGFGLLFLHMLGAVTITTPSGAINTRLHRHVLADLFGKSLTVQGGIPDVNGTVQPFSWLGCKVTEWELSQAVGELLMLSVDLDGRDETTAQALGSPSFATGELFHFGQCAVTVAGSPFHATELSLSGNNGLATERRFLYSSTLKKEPIHESLREFEGELTGEFEDLTAYNRFVNKNIVGIVFTWTGPLIEGSFNYKLEINLPACIFTGETPKVSGPEIVEQPLPFKVLNNGSAEPVTIDYYTTDTAS
jgi:hypothetical protein